MAKVHQGQRARKRRKRLPPPDRAAVLDLLRRYVRKCEREAVLLHAKLAKYRAPRAA